MDDCYELYYKDRRETEEDEETKKETVFISIKMPEKIMNEKADEIFMTSTNFTNSSGIHDPGNVSTARDIADVVCVLDVCVYGTVEGKAGLRVSQCWW